MFGDGAAYIEDPCSESFVGPDQGKTEVAEQIISLKPGVQHQIDAALPPTICCRAIEPVPLGFS